jgi:prepilin-type N-terminal cleavage/methylation domain-containing protein
MQSRKKAFTLVEVLISITLLSLVLMALYKSADLMRNSNLHLYHYLQKASMSLKGSKTLYKDLMYADHNITINTEEKFHRLTIYNTGHSLHGLAQAKVVWLVYKKDNTLLRLEGEIYHIPLKSEERVEIDVIAKNLELFKIYRSKKKDKVLAMIQIAGQEPQLFMSQNIPEPPPAPKSSNSTKAPSSRNQSVIQ